MPLLNVKGVHVNFPFEPYPCQLDYMNKVIECLQNGVNGVLESPTGTGKTLCLLCSSLAWQESKKAQCELNRQVSVSQLLGSSADKLTNKTIDGIAKGLESSTGKSWGGTDFDVPKIIYASRTHSQLSQVVQELKRTAYNSVKVSIIGSRDQLCIHEQVKKEQNNTNKVHMCRSKVNSRTCYYYNHLESLKSNTEPRVLMGNVVDIEDLVTYGQKNKACPYYLARELKSDADIIFMPYNYLLDPKSRKAHGIEIGGNVVIFDEAHNLERICEDSSSFDMKPGDLATAIEEVNRLIEKMLQSETGTGDIDDSQANVGPDFELGDLLKLKQILIDLEEAIDKIDVPKNDKGINKPGMFMFELLSQANINFENKDILIDVLDKIVMFITADASGAGSGVTKGAGLTKMSDVLKIVFSQEAVSDTSKLEQLSRHYKVHLQRDDKGFKKKQMDLWTNSSAAEKSGKTLSYWCFSPGQSMKNLLSYGVKCIVMTSGTLSPLGSLIAEMQIDFPVQLENPHVIQKHQFWIGTLKQGPDGTTLNSNFENRFKTSYQASLGNCIVNFARVVPNGLLIFYPSYTVMEKCLEHWKETNIWSRIEQYKQIFVEPKSKGVLNDVMNDFYSKINDTSLNGAIFIAVCRGKVSEGLDFSDINGRAVVITGLPYPPYLDPKVVLKMQYLDECKEKSGLKTILGKEWYKQQASRAVNQAIGRVIRHKDDFGAIILCDTRFAGSDSVRQLPVWVRSYVNKYDTFGSAMKDIMFFFKNAEKVMPAPKPTKKSSSGCTGAYFVPTITRTNTNGQINAQPAHNVIQHVPSLKHKDNSVSNDNLCEAYRGGHTASSSGSQKSLFSALDHSEKCHEDTQDSQIPSFQTNFITTEMRKPTNKKKIIIKKRSSVTDKVTTDISTEVSSTVSMSSVNTAENFIAEIKSTLSGESYKLFTRTLIDYKKTENFDKCIESLASLFTEDIQKHHLFAKFYRFVRPHHKEKYHNICKELTGLDTGYRPEDTVNKKRIQEAVNSGHENEAKRLKVDWDSKDKKDNNKTNTASSSTNQCVSVNTVIPSTSCSNKENNSKNITQDATVEKPSTSTSGGENKSRKYGPAKSGYICVKCKQDAKIPFISQCEHVCCVNCWKQVFEGDKLCPACKLRVRRRQLIQLHFQLSDT